MNKCQSRKISENILQWRIMSLAEFGFVSLTPGHTSARHDWKDANTPRTDKAKSK